MLDSIDEAIERAETVITSTEQLRDALLHDLLTKGVPGWHTEWKDAPNIGQIPACWEVARLGDVAEVKGGKRLPKGAAFANEPTDYPYIRVVDLGHGSVNVRNIQFLSDSIRQIHCELHDILSRYLHFDRRNDRACRAGTPENWTARTLRRMRRKLRSLRLM